MGDEIKPKKKKANPLGGGTGDNPLGGGAKPKKADPLGLPSLGGQPKKKLGK